MRPHGMMGRGGVGRRMARRLQAERTACVIAGGQHAGHGAAGNLPMMEMAQVLGAWGTGWGASQI